jgi:hypothetical protein
MQRRGIARIIGSRRWGAPLGVGDAAGLDHMHVDREEQLLRRLRDSLSEEQRGFTAEMDGRSGVLILNRGHYRGVWHWLDGAYSFTPGGYASSTHSAPTPQDAVRYTLDHVCKQ